MMMEDKFYNNVHAKLANFQPEVPASVYSGVRRKMWVKSFTSFHLSRFNMWYVLLAVAITGGVLATTANTHTLATKAETHQSKMPSKTAFSNGLEAEEEVVSVPTALNMNVSRASANRASVHGSEQKKNSTCESLSVSSNVVSSSTEKVVSSIEASPATPATELPTTVVERELAQPKEKEQPIIKGKKLVVPILVDEKK